MGGSGGAGSGAQPAKTGGRVVGSGAKSAQRSHGHARVPQGGLCRTEISHQVGAGGIPELDACAWSHPPAAMPRGAVRPELRALEAPPAEEVADDRQREPLNHPSVQTRNPADSAT